ncbi:MAG: YdiU family protein [Ilumatobacteraceae bacterium]
MSPSGHPLFTFTESDFLELRGLYEQFAPVGSPEPRLLSANDELAAELGLDPRALHGADGLAVLSGNQVPAGATPVAQAYAGHQFGGLSPRLGDGRALLLGEVIDVHGRRRDIHMKGSGRTPFARGGDGRAAVGPMLREHLIGEAMHTLGIPTTRALAVVATCKHVVRDSVLPGAILTRVASSHLRVGTFQYAAMHDRELLRALADHAIERHHPNAAEAPNRYLALVESVLAAQASLVARWMLVGFVHGVMNTDNMTISGETIDYGPCAFMEAFDPATVFSSIDHGGRYAYGNQPPIAQWNLTRLAEAMLPLLADDTDGAVAAATAVLETFPDRFHEHWTAGMRDKLGLVDVRPDDEALFAELLGLMQSQRVDHTAGFRSLSGVLIGAPERARSLFADRDTFDDWARRWIDRVSAQGPDAHAAAAATAMDRVNPIYLARNHLVEAALSAATDGDMAPFDELLGVVLRPFDERPGLEAYTLPAPADFGTYRTFCGT